MAQLQINMESELLHELFSKDGRDAAFNKLLETILNQVLSHEATEQLRAGPYERNDNRQDYRNGNRDRRLQTRIGTIILSVPRFRSGEFSTSLFNRYQRSEQALVLAMIEMVINGVSTRKIKAITAELCGTSFSKSTVSSLCKRLDPEVHKFRNRPLEKHYPFLIVDAICTKVRRDSRVISMSILIAIGINENGHREILGFSLADSESESSWDVLFKSLKHRGLKNVDMIASDDHSGLVKSVGKNFQGAVWQRCQTHFSRNILDVTPKRLQPEMKNCLCSLYNAMDMEKARSIQEEMIKVFEATAPKAMEKLENGFDDILAVLNLPLKYRRRLRTTNSSERLNEEIRRRERVIRIFPNEDSVIRLIGALLIEHNEKWLTGKKYFDMEEYYESKKKNKKKEALKIA
ncbi:MAG TPA: IS256 family transposase [Candidatus Marinimicrobia bacterium]|nr:IS256 family transposase [Candidatus Neomarinimicrobiota bacterium]